MKIKVDKSKIEEALRLAELKTSAEILPVIVKRSTYTRHVRVTLFLLILSLILFLENYFGLIGVWLWISPVAAGVLAFLLSPLRFIENLFILKADRAAQINTCAELVFFEQGLYKTEKGTGILLFISLHERYAVVLADEGIAKKVPKDIWKDVISRLTTVAKKEDITVGLSEAIKLCGEIAATHFPADPNNKNEIPNRLIIKD